MSYEKMRVYECSVCHRFGIGIDTGILPPEWCGSAKKHGVCLCPECVGKVLDKKHPTIWAKYTYCDAPNGMAMRLDGECRRLLPMG